MNRLRWPTLRLFLISAVAWTAFMGLTLWSEQAAARAQGFPPLGERFLDSMRYVIWWILGTPFLFRFAERVPILNRRWPLVAAMHVVIGLVWSLGAAHLALATTVTPEMAAAAGIPPIPPRWILMDTMAYMVVVLVAQAALYARQAIDRERAAVDLLVRNSELAQALTRAELQTLRYRLQPHFLHNALNSVVALVRRGDQDAAVETLIGVSELLRQVTDEDGPPLVPLEHELAFVKRYLEVERVRFRDRMETRFETDPESMTALVPNLLLQPLAENAVRHGVGERLEPTTVMVRTRRVGDRIEIEISNDGPDLDDADLATSGGVGLRLTTDRLQHAFGEAGAFDLETHQDRVVARVSFPFLDSPGSLAGEHSLAELKSKPNTAPNTEPKAKPHSMPSNGASRG